MFKIFFTDTIKKYKLYTIKINDDDLICGKKTGLVYQKCTDSLSIQFVVGQTAYKGMKLYYERKISN